MQMQVYETEFCGDPYWIRADWSHPHCQVAMATCDGFDALDGVDRDWVYCGFEVEEATEPSTAMEMILAEVVRNSGDDPGDEDNTRLIATAVAKMKAVES